MYLNEIYHTPKALSYTQWYEHICEDWRKKPRVKERKNYYDKGGPVYQLTVLLDDIAQQDEYDLKELVDIVKQIPSDVVDKLKISSDMYSGYDCIEGSIYCYTVTDETPEQTKDRLEKEYKVYIASYNKYHENLQNHIKELRYLKMDFNGRN